MKTLFLYLIASIAFSLSATSYIVAHRLSSLEMSGEIVFGPQPSVSPNFYNFDNSTSAFDLGVDLKLVKFYSKSEFEEIVLNSLKLHHQKKFDLHLEATLQTAEDYQIDPFWVIAIMMVESGFNTQAISHKKAHGLMQVQPETALHLYQLMNKDMDDSKIVNTLFDPDQNIEIGVFYLKKLLQNFRLNYTRATIAYNVGPNRLKNLIETSQFNEKEFEYLIKVENSYKSISKNFVVNSKSSLNFFASSLLFLPPYTKNSAVNIVGSENLSDNSLQSLNF